MYQIKSIVNFADYIFGLIWSYSFIELIPYLGSLSVFSSVDEKVKSYLLIVGLFYGIARLIFYCMKGIRENARAILEEKKLAQEIENNRVDFYKKFNQEFLKDNKL